MARTKGLPSLDGGNACDSARKTKEVPKESPPLFLKMAYGGDSQHF